MVAPERAESNALPARVLDVVYLGEDLQITAETEGGLALTASFKASDTDRDLVAGSAVTVWVTPGDVRLLLDEHRP